MIWVGEKIHIRNFLSFSLFPHSKKAKLLDLCILRFVRFLGKKAWLRWLYKAKIETSCQSSSFGDSEAASMGGIVLVGVDGGFVWGILPTGGVGSIMLLWRDWELESGGIIWLDSPMSPFASVESKEFLLPSATGWMFSKC